MEITEIANKDEWESLLKKFPTVCFLQSWNWGEFQESLGSKVKRVVVTDKGQRAAAQYYIKKSRLFTYLYCPRGPLADSRNPAIALLGNLKEVAKTEKADFILIEPEDIKDWNLPVAFVEQIPMQPQNTSMVSLALTIEELRSNLRKTTRQMIKKAEESKVAVKTYTDLSRWSEFMQLFKETAQRQKITPHSLSYMKKQLETFSGDGQAKLYLAEVGGKAMAGAIIISYHGTSIYLHAASTSEGRKIGAAQLLVWTAIQDAKEEGNSFFDLWGVAPSEDPSHPWAGISIFKFGFGGETVSYPGGFALPIRGSRYKLYLFTSFLRTLPVFRIAQRVLLRAMTKG